MTMKLISSATASGSSAVIDITSIQQTFTYLYLVYSLRAGTPNVNHALFLNFNDTGTGYTGRVLYGTGSSAASFTRTTSEFLLSTGSNATANTFSSGFASIPNYAGSANKLTIFNNVTENNATASEQNIAAALWSNTAAITKITFFTGSANFAAGSTVSLYGIQRGSGGATVS